MAASLYHPNSNGAVERVNYIMAQMISMAVNESQNDWDKQRLPHIQFAFNNSFSAVTDLVPTKIRIGHLTRLPLSVFERPNI